MDKYNMKELLNAIEKLRKELNSFSNSNLTDPKLLTKSQELDKLLNDYYHILEEEKNNK